MPDNDSYQTGWDHLYVSFTLMLAWVFLIGFGGVMVWVVLSLLDPSTHKKPSAFDVILLLGCALGITISGWLIYILRSELRQVDYMPHQPGPAPRTVWGIHPPHTARQPGQSPASKHQAAGGQMGSTAVPPHGGQAPGTPPGDPAQPQPQPPQLVPFQQMAPAPFENKEPDDPLYPYDDVVEHGIPERAGGKGWAIVGSSRRGFSHEHDGKYREDAMAFDIVDGWHLVAVADGGGAYSLARLGANVAVENALAAMKACIQSNKSSSFPLPFGKAKTQLMPREVARQAVLEGFRAAYDGVQRKAIEIGENDAKQLRTTLLLLAHRQERDGTHVVAGGQIGDGILVGRDGQNNPLKWFGEPDTGPSNNEVLFLQDVSRDELSERAKVYEDMAGPGCQFLVMTDGVADDFLPIDENLARLEKPLFESVLAGKSPSEAAHALTELLGYQRDASFDDRTLVCIYELSSAQ